LFKHRIGKCAGDFKNHGRTLLGVSHIDFYVAFAFWKLACILEGVYARYLGGALGERSAEELEPFNQQVLAAAANAEMILDTLK
jgi:hypothetical protein